MTRRSTRLFRHTLVREARKARDITNERLAREVHVTLRTVQRWQDGTSEPRGGQLLDLARALNVEPDAFYEDVPEVAA